MRQLILSLTVLLALSVLEFAASAGQIGVFSTDFNGAVPPEFSGVTTTVPVGEYDGLGTGANVFSGSFLLNATGLIPGQPPGNPGDPTRLTLANLPPHASIELNFLLAIIDTWDGSQTHPSAPDYFNVTVDGASVFRESFDNYAWDGLLESFNPDSPGVVLARRVQLGFSLDPTHVDSAFDMGLQHSAFGDIPHTSNTLTIEWFADGAGWQGWGMDESWAIDNVEVLLIPEPCAMVVLLTGALGVLARAWRRRKRAA